MEAIISSIKTHKVRDRDVSVSYSKAYLYAHGLLKQEQQEVNNHTEISKNVSCNSVLTSLSSPEIKVNSVRKRKTLSTSKCLGKMVETNLSQFKNEGNDRDSDDSGEGDRCKEDMEMDTQDCTGCNGEGTDDGDSDDNTGDLSQYKPIQLEDKDTKNNDDFLQDNISEIKHEVTGTSEEDDGDDLSQYRAIKLEDEGGNDDDSLLYKAITLEDEVTNTSYDEEGDSLQYRAIELEGDITKTSGGGGGGGGDDDDDDFPQYKAIELEDDDFSQYKPIELEDEVTER
jgi:hypothetical protein